VEPNQNLVCFPTVEVINTDCWGGQLTLPAILRGFGSVLDFWNSKRQISLENCSYNIFIPWFHVKKSDIFVYVAWLLHELTALGGVNCDTWFMC